MINFPRSTFTWESHPHEPDPYYKWPGGFVGKDGQVYHVRFNLEAQCKITEEASGKTTELFLGAPCRSEYTIARRNLFQVPSGEWRMAFSRTSTPTIAQRPRNEEEPASKKLLSEGFVNHVIDIRTFDQVEELSDAASIVKATLANDLLSARSTYRDAARGFSVAVEYPVNLINLNATDAEFQVCTGPVLLPDLATWDGEEVSRIFVAHVAITAFDHVEFILRRAVAAAPEEREWLDKPRGLDRLELIDPNNIPSNYPPSRSQPTAYNEVWELAAENVVLRAVGA